METAAGEAEREARAERERQERELEVARSLALAQASATRRLRVGLAAAVLLLPGVAATYTARQLAHTAEDARAREQTTIEDALGVAQLLLESVDRELRDLAGTTEVRGQILRSGAALLDRLSAGVEPAALARLERSRAQYHEQEAQLALSSGHATRAREEIEAALQIRERLAQSSPENTAAQLALAEAHESFGSVLRTRGQRAEARVAYEKALALRTALAQKHPENAELALGVASTRRLLDGFLAAFEVSDQEFDEQRRAAELLESLVARSPTDSALRSELAQAYFHLARVVQDPEENLDYLQRALAIQGPLAQENAHSLRAQQALSETYGVLGDSNWYIGDMDSARRAFEASVAIDRKLAQGDPSAVPRLIDTLANFGSFETFAGRFPAGRAHLEEMIRLAESLGPEGRDSDSVNGALGYSLCILAEASQELDRTGSARQSLERALAILRGMLERDPNDGPARRNQLDCSRQLGLSAQQQGKLSEARAAFTSALSLGEQMFADLLGNLTVQRLVRAQMTLAGLDLAEGRLAEARSALEHSLQRIESIPEQRRRTVEWVLEWPENQSWLGRTAQAEGRFTDAIRHHELALTAYQTVLKEQSTNTRVALEVGRAQRDLGAALEAAGRSGEARRQYAGALASSQLITERDPSNFQAQRGLADAHSDLGRLAQSAGRLPEARAAYGQAQAILEELLRANPKSESLRARLAEALRERGRVAQAAGALPEARRLLEQARDGFRDLVQQDPQNAAAGRELAISQRWLGELAASEGKLAEALSDQRRSLELIRELLTHEPTDFQARHALVQSQLSLASAQRSAGEPDQARLTLKHALASAEQNLQQSATSTLAKADLAEARARLTAARSAGPHAR